MFLHMFKVTLSASAALNPAQNSPLAPKSASLLQLGRCVLIGRLGTLSYPHTHTSKVSRAFFSLPHISYSLSLSISSSLALHL